MEFARPDAKSEAEIFSLLLKYSLDPYGFVMVAYPWNVPGTPLEGIKGPRPWQVEELKRIGKAMQEAAWAKENGLPYDVYRAAFSSGRGPGKSALLSWLAHWHISTHMGANTIVAANTEKQLYTKIFPEIAKWVTLGINKHWFTTEGIVIKPAGWFAQLGAEQLSIDPRFWGVFGQMWQEENPVSFSGGRSAYGMLVLFDEASGIPETIWNVTQGFFMSPNPPVYRIWIAASQMHRPSGRFYDLFYDPVHGEGWRTLTMDTSDPKYGVDPNDVAKAIKQHGVDSDYVRVEIRGLPPKQGDKQLIPTDDIMGARDREFQADENEPLILGVDPAPRGRTVCRFRRGRDARSIPPFVLEGKDNVQIAEFIMQLIARYNPDAIVVDAGMGTGVIDVLKRYRVKVKEVWFGEAAPDGGEFALVGAMLWGRVRDWLPGGMIDKSDTLLRDLMKREWRWYGREEKQKCLESKQDAKARGVPSPDDGDALALTFMVNPPRRDRFSRRVEGRPTIAEGGYNDSLFKV